MNGASAGKNFSDSIQPLYSAMSSFMVTSNVLESLRVISRISLVPEERKAYFLISLFLQNDFVIHNYVHRS